MHPLVQLAKDSIHALFSKEKVTLPEGFEEHQGCFVTLNKNKELRGCIGFITTKKSLKETVQEAARAAAKNDPRFPSLEEEELKDITIEVSVLSIPKKVMSNDPTTRMEAFNPGETGLIMQRGWKSGLLLPQVFKKDTPAQEALEMTCWKAELPKDAWRKAETNMYTFTATIYEE